MIKKLMLMVAIIVLAVSSSTAQQSSNKEEIKIQTNLDCDACKKKIENYMAFEKGVTAVSADVPTKIVTIEYRPNRTDEDKLIAALKKIGFEADVVKEEKPDTE